MRLVITFALLLSLKKITWCIPLSQFYPYGQTESDDVLLKADDRTSPGVSLSSVFPFYDKNFQMIYVSIIVLYNSYDNWLANLACIFIGISPQ